MTVSPPRYEVRALPGYGRAIAMWGVFDTFAQEFVSNADAGLQLTAWRDRRVADSAARRLNAAYDSVRTP